MSNFIIPSGIIYSCTSTCTETRDINTLRERRAQLDFANEAAVPNDPVDAAYAHEVTSAITRIKLGFQYLDDLTTLRNQSKRKAPDASVVPATCKFMKIDEDHDDDPTDDEATTHAPVGCSKRRSSVN